MYGGEWKHVQRFDGEILKERDTEDIIKVKFKNENGVT